MTQNIPIDVIHLGMQEYLPTYEAMKEYTQNRDDTSADQIWVLEHPPVFTLGLAGEIKHLLEPNSSIEVVQVDRGGQITYHGPGQLIVYLLINLKRHHLFVRTLVHKMEEAIIQTLAFYGVIAIRKAGAPGIYLSDSNEGFETLAGAKIAALGLKVTKHCTYHGLSLNVSMDLKPFSAINPCGFAGLQTVDLATLNKNISMNEVAQTLVKHLLFQLEKDERLGKQ